MSIKCVFVLVLIIPLLAFLIFEKKKKKKNVSANQEPAVFVHFKSSLVLS